MRDALLDLVLGGACAVCGTPGRALCRACWSLLPAEGFTCWPTPAPEGLARPVAAGDYDGALKLLVNAHKERQRFALARPLGMLLATAVTELAGPASGLGPGTWVLVPVPSRRAVVRRRGHDPLLRVAREAARILRRSGVHAEVARLVRSVRTVRDQAGLDASGRARNLTGSMRCPTDGAAARRLRRSTAARLVVVDDVVTTGSTAREAQRALEEADLEVSGIAAVAATRRRIPAETSASLPFSRTDD